MDITDLWFVPPGKDKGMSTGMPTGEFSEFARVSASARRAVLKINARLVKGD